MNNPNVLSTKNRTWNVEYGYIKGKMHFNFHRIITDIINMKTQP